MPSIDVNKFGDPAESAALFRNAIPKLAVARAPRFDIIEFLDMLWRAFATGFCFATFGLGQLLLGLSVFPLMLLLIRNPLRRRRLAKYAIHLSFKAFVLLMWLTRVLDFEIHHQERLQRSGLLVLANHPSLIDAVFLVSFIGQADCVVKSKLFKNPFIRFAAKGAGYISNDDDSLAVVEACRTSFQEGNTLLVFPEATRSEPGTPLSLRRGAAQIAVRTSRDITPVIIRAREHNLGKQSHWWKVPRKRMSFDFTVNEDLPIAPYITPGKEAALAARELTECLTEYFNKETHEDAVQEN
jgi:1-acyl-sn-glycerol-3-phosphate acyltransferase